MLLKKHTDLKELFLHKSYKLDFWGTISSLQYTKKHTLKNCIGIAEIKVSNIFFKIIDSGIYPDGELGRIIKKLNISPDTDSFIRIIGTILNEYMNKDRGWKFPEGLNTAIWAYLYQPVAERGKECPVFIIPGGTNEYYNKLPYGKDYYRFCYSYKDKKKEVNRSNPQSVQDFITLYYNQIESPEDNCLRLEIVKEGDVLKGLYKMVSKKDYKFLMHSDDIRVFNMAMEDEMKGDYSYESREKARVKIVGWRKDRTIWEEYKKDKIVNLSRISGVDETSCRCVL